MSKDLMVTTVDNPYNPFTEFYEWLSFDIEKGYNTCGLLARLCFTFKHSTALHIKHYTKETPFYSKGHLTESS